MSRLSFHVLCIVAILTSATTGIAQEKTNWKAGAAKIKITPEKLIWMSGYGGRDKPAEGLLTELWAKALVLEDPAGGRAVLVTMDLVGIHRDVSLRVCKQLEQRHGLKRHQIALCASHTHTGPVVGDNLRAMYFLDETQDKRVVEYTAELETRLVAVVADAILKIAPARLSWSTGRTTFAVNRRTNREADVPKLRAAGLLKGPVDHDVPVLAVRGPDGNLRAIACGYACHATVLSFMQWSGDWPGFAQIELEKNHPDALALFWAGCGADQNPLPRRTVELAQQYGRQLAAAVDAELSGPMQAVEGTLSASYTEIDLPFGKLPTREEVEKDAASSDRFVVGRAKRLLKTWDQNQGLAATYPYPVQIWRFGAEPALVFLGGEVVVDYSLRLKQELGPKLWVAGYSNDVMAYIPSRRVLTEGGYEGAGAMVYYGLPASWAPDVEERIIAEVRRQIGAGK